MKKGPTMIEDIKKEVLKEYGGNGITNPSVLDDIEWAIDYLHSKGYLPVWNEDMEAAKPKLLKNTREKWRDIINFIAEKGEANIQEICEKFDLKEAGVRSQLRHYVKNNILERSCVGVFKIKTERKKLENDLLLYGVSFERENGERIDPQEVYINE